MPQVRELPDADLVARCRAGEADAWSALVERFSRYVYAICVRGFRMPIDEAEDVFQDVFARTYEQLPRLRDDAAIRPWIGQLTRRACVDRLRRAAAHPEVDADEILLADRADSLGELEQALDVHQALESLGEPCSDVLDRFFTRDESYRTIGEALDLPAGTIASRISRCLEKLKAFMEDPGPLDRPVDR